MIVLQQLVLAPVKQLMQQNIPIWPYVIKLSTFEILLNLQKSRMLVIVTLFTCQTYVIMNDYKFI